MTAQRLFWLLALSIAAIAVALPVLFGVSRHMWIAEGLVGATALIAAILYPRLVRPARVAALGMDLLREQDYSSRLAPVGQRDADKVVALFNDLMARLKAEKLRVREQNQILDLLIEASPLAILSLGDGDTVTMCNSMAARILGENPKGRPLRDLQSPLAAVSADLGRDRSETVRLSDTMVYRCSRMTFMDCGVPRPFVLIEILTDEVRRAERDAYGKVIRVIGHEVNNSMASIRSLLELLLELRPWEGTTDADDLERTVEGCVHRARLLGDFISAYTKVVKIPAAKCERRSLAQVVQAMEPFLTSMATEGGVKISFAYPDGPQMALVDASLMEQAVINIVKNAIESIHTRRLTDGAGRIDIEVGTPRRLTVTDNGAGITPETSRRLFTPFFSTKPSGQGLGLMFVAEILDRHGASFSLATSAADSLTRFTMGFKG